MTNQSVGAQNVADRKISDFEIATSASPSDFFPVVQGNQNRRMTLGTLFQQMNVASGNSRTKLSTSEVIFENTSLDLTKALYIANPVDGPIALSLRSSLDGDLKTIVNINEENSATVITSVQANGFRQIEIQPYGSVILIAAANKWSILSLHQATIIS